MNPMLLYKIEKNFPLQIIKYTIYIENKHSNICFLIHNNSKITIL